MQPDVEDGIFIFGTAVAFTAECFRNGAKNADASDAVNAGYRLVLAVKASGMDLSSMAKKGEEEEP